MISKDNLNQLLTEFVRTSFINRKTPYKDINDLSHLCDVSCFKIRMDKLLHGLNFIIGDTVKLKNKKDFLNLQKNSNCKIENIELRINSGSGVVLLIDGQWYDSSFFEEVIR
jgi:hypothetical protein